MSNSGFARGGNQRAYPKRWSLSDGNKVVRNVDRGVVASL